jgi:hypothetical protein
MITHSRAKKGMSGKMLKKEMGGSISPERLIQTLIDYIVTNHTQNANQ